MVVPSQAAQNPISTTYHVPRDLPGVTDGVATSFFTVLDLRCRREGTGLILGGVLNLKNGPDATVGARMVREEGV